MNIPLPLNFKAAILAESRAQLVVDEVSFAGPLLKDQVLVKVRYSGICGKQVEEIDAHFGHDRYLPHLLGHEGSGTVEAVGVGVEHLELGDAVVMHWMKGPGPESALPQYTWRGSKLNAGLLTTFNQYAVVSQNRLTKISADVNLALASLLGCGVSTGAGAVFNEADVQPGESVIVWGVGGVGLAVVQAARLRQASAIAAVDFSDRALEIAQSCGASVIVNPRTESIDRLRALFPAGIHKGFVCVNSPEAIAMCHPLMATPSELIVVGVPAPGSYVQIDALDLHKRRTITGSFGGSIHPERDIADYLGLLESGKIDPAFLLGPCLPLDRINDGIAQTRRGGVGRVLIDLWG